MTIKALLIRFTAIYIVFLMAIATIFVLLDAKANSGVNTGALAGAVLAACYWFAYKNKRYFSAGEKKTVIISMCLINILVQTLAALIFTKVSGLKLPFGTMFLGIMLIGLLHSIGIYVFVGIAGKQYAKQA